jgi:hypothetical protein
MNMGQAIRQASMAVQDRNEGAFRVWTEEEAERAARDDADVASILKNWRDQGRFGPLPIFEGRSCGGCPPKVYLGFTTDLI